MALFNLPSSASELVSANQGTANAQYRQITSTRNVQTTAFHNGVIQFRFETGGNSWFVPDKSYFRIRFKYLQVREDDGAFLPPLTSGDMAPSMGLASQLMQSVEVRLNGQTVERIGERLSLIDALKTRMGKSKAWLDSVGKNTNFWSESFESRKQDISVDGYSQCEDMMYTPSYETSPIMTSVQAGFTPTASFQYTVNTNIIEVIADNANNNFLIGPMAVRPGDRFVVRTIVAATDPVEYTDDFVLEILHVNTKARLLTKVISGTQATITNDNVPSQAKVWWQRLSPVASNCALQKNEGELIWQPPLGFFDKQHALPPGGNWTIEFIPENRIQYKRNAVESMHSNLDPNLTDIQTAVNGNKAGQFDFTVEQMYLYLYTVDSRRFDNDDYFLDIGNVRCQVENIPKNSTGLIQKNFDVAGKTNALTLAFQDQQAGVDTRYAQSKFKIRPNRNKEGEPQVVWPNTSVTKGQSTWSGQDLLLNRFFINYNNLQKPSPDYDGQWKEVLNLSTDNAVNFMTQRWTDTLMQSAAYHTEGGAETLNEWIKRGPYYHFLWPKDAVENNTRVNINYGFTLPLDDGSEHKILLFNWWRTAYHIVHRNGRVEKMSVETL